MNKQNKVDVGTCNGKREIGNEEGSEQQCCGCFRGIRSWKPWTLGTGVAPCPGADDWTHSIRLVVAVKHGGAVIVSRQISLSKPGRHENDLQARESFRLGTRVRQNWGSKMDRCDGERIAEARNVPTEVISVHDWTLSLFFFFQYWEVQRTTYDNRAGSFVSFAWIQFCLLNFFAIFLENRENTQSSNMWFKWNVIFKRGMIGQIN